MSDVISPNEKAWTGREVLEAKQELEREISMALGSIVIAFTRLEFDVAMFLAWQDDGREEERNSVLVAAMLFATRLKTLEGLAGSKFGLASEEYQRYATWIEQVSRLRKVRNCLVHGRWGFESMKGLAANVVGLPSAGQEVEHYRPADLLSLRDKILLASKELQRLGKEIPV